RRQTIAKRAGAYTADWRAGGFDGVNGMQPWKQSPLEPATRRLRFPRQDVEDRLFGRTTQSRAARGDDNGAVHEDGILDHETDQFFIGPLLVIQIQFVIVRFLAA